MVKSDTFCVGAQLSLETRTRLSLGARVVINDDNLDSNSQNFSHIVFLIGQQLGTGQYHGNQCDSGIIALAMANHRPYLIERSLVNTGPICPHCQWY